MKRRGLLVLVVIVLAMLGFWAWHSELWTSGETTSVSPLSEDVASQSIETLVEPAPGARATADRSAPIAPQTVAPELVTVIGRIVDAAHQPVRGSRVFLRSPGEPWSRAGDAPEVRLPDVRINAWEAVTQDDGVFRYEVPKPDVTYFELSSRSSIHLARLLLSFNRTFAAGTTDLGEFVLDARGAIEGFVRTQSGDAVQHAMVASQSAAAPTYTDERGHYLLGSVREGVAVMSVHPMLHRDAFRDGIEIRNGVTTVLDVTVDPAPVLSGRIVDTSGRPVAWARIMATLVGGEGPKSAGQSREDGAFVMRLSRPEPHHIDVTSPGFVTQRLEKRYADSESDIVIVLVSAPQFTFRVVDHASGLPIERFGIEVRDAGESPMGPLGWITNQSAHPAGEVKLEAAPELQVVRVAAAGKAPLEMHVSADPGSASVQTIRMHAGAVVRGRVLDRGQPAAGVFVSVKGTFVGDDGSGKPAGSAPMDLSLWLGGRRSARCDADGAFRIERIPAGTWALSVSGPSIESRIVRVITIAEDAVIDAGTIEVTPGATLVGRLIIPTGRTPAGIFVSLDAGRTGNFPDESGSFRFSGVAPGKHTVLCRRSSLAATGDHSVDVELAAGETKEITIDLTATLPAYVITRVVRSLMPVGGARIALDASGRTVQWAAGTTTPDGLAEVECPPNQPVQLWVVGAAKTNLGSTAPMTLAPEQRVEREILLVDGTLEIELPDTIAVPESGWVAIDLGTGEGGRFSCVARTRGSARARDVDWTSGRIVVGSVAPSHYSVDVRVHVQVGDVVRQTGPFACVAVVRANETTLAKPK